MREERGSVIAETRRVVAPDTDASITGTDADASVAAVSEGSSLVVADSFATAADANILATATLGLLLGLLHIWTSFAFDRYVDRRRGRIDLFLALFTLMASDFGIGMMCR